MVHINVVAQALATTVQSCAKMGKFYFHFTLDTPKKKKQKFSICCIQLVVNSTHKSTAN